MTKAILAPVVALILWSFVMWAWLYATRIPAIRRLKIVYDPYQPNSEFTKQMPARVRWIADNYNNLMEQPPLFYAVALTLAMLGAAGGLDVALAWAYVALRIGHSLIHALVNIVIWRFAVFMLASVVLLALTVRTALFVF